MYMQKKILLLFLAALTAAALHAQTPYAPADSSYRRWFVGSSLFLLGNFSTVNSPDFAQLNLGYRLSRKDVVSLEFITWKTAWPIGMHFLFTKSYGKKEEAFPGYIRDYGIALTYQRFLWKGLYAQVHVMPSLQDFVNQAGKKVDTGFQLFNTYRIGYHLNLWKDRIFIQPSLAITHRPYHTRMPDDFKRQDDKWSKFLFGEPGMHIGYTF